MGINNNRNSKGFTLVEMLVAVGIIAIIVPSIFALFFANLRAQSKVIILQEVKRNGDNALSTIETLVKERAASVHSGNPPTAGNEVCDAIETYNGVLTFIDKDGDWFSVRESYGKIASGSASFSGDITNDKVTISSYSMSCERASAFSEPLVSVSFTVSQSSSSDRKEDIASIDYQTKMRLRPN